MVRAALLIAVLAAGSAAAQGSQGEGEAWSDPGYERAPAQPAAAMRSPRPAACGGFFTHAWFPQAEVYVPVNVGGSVGGPGSIHPATPGGVTGSGDGASLGSGLNEPVALLAVAVVVVAAAPVFFYAIDSEAAPDVAHCWWLPSARFGLQGGSSGSTIGSTGLLSTRASFGAAFFGIEAGAEGSYWHRGADAHLLFRIPPRQHVELNVGLGVRTYEIGDFSSTWFELSLPHRYYPWRHDSWVPGVAFELRPAVLVASTRTLDFRLDATVDLPMSPWASVQLGGRAFSFGGRVHFAALGGISVAP